MPLTYCFAGSDIKARRHVAFLERSGAPSRLPVHLHNVATCHTEAGITNLCLSHVAGRSRCSCSCPNFVFFPPARPSLCADLCRRFPVAPPHVSLFVQHSFIFGVNRVKIVTVGNKKHHFPRARHKRGEARGWGGGRPGAVCQHQLCGLWRQGEGLILM